MGKTAFGSISHEGNADLITPQQQEMFTKAGDIYGNMAGPEAFQTGFVDPMMMQFQQQTLPAVQQRFVDANAGSSSALNQALAQSAQDLQTQLGQYYMQAQQGAAQGYAGLAGQRQFEPLIAQRQGWFGPTMGALGQAAGGYYGGGS